MVGLAIGFVCFALSLLWIRYEITYNQDYPDSDRIFLLGEGRFDITFKSELHNYLTEHFPEIEKISSLCLITYQEAGQSVKRILQVTPEFFEMFGVQFTSGSPELFFQDSLHLLVTEKERIREKDVVLELSEKLTFHPDNILFIYPINANCNPFAKKYDKIHDSIFFAGYAPYNIIGLVKETSEHTDFSFDYIMPFRENDITGPHWVYTFVKLHEGVDYEVFNKKLEISLLKINECIGDNIEMLSLYPLYDFHLSKENIFLSLYQPMSFDNIVLLASAAFITILCLLFNYLALFMSRLQQIKRDIALRMAIGASLKELYTMMAVEFFLILLGAFLLGCLIVEIILPYFCLFTNMPISATAIWTELALYFLILVLFSLLLLIWPLVYFKRQTFAMLFQTVETNREKRLFSRNALVGVQLVVGILFIFCSVVFFKQIHYLKNIDPGFEPERFCIASAPNFANYHIIEDELIEKIRNLPEIESVSGFREKTGKYIFSKRDSVKIDLSGSDPQVVLCRPFGVFPSHFDLWKIRLLQGELFREDDPDWK